jgi:hypothetical protein
VSVGPGAPPAADFQIDSLRAQRSGDGTASVLAKVRNTGGRALDVSGTLRLSEGPAGLGAGPFPAKLGTTLAIGETEPVTIELDSALPAGRWKAHITLRSGLLEREVSADIEVPAIGEEAPPAVSTTTRAETGPTAALTVAGLAVATLAVALAASGPVRRRRRLVASGRHALRRA